MSERLPTLTPQKMRRIVERLGFVFQHQRGSHAYFRHVNGRWTSIAMHAKDVPRGTMKKILRDIGVSYDEIKQFL